MKFKSITCTLKTMTKYDWSAIFRKIHAIYYTVFLTHSIGRIIIQSEFKIHFVLSKASCHDNTFPPPKISPELNTRNCHLRTCFYKITLNYTYCDFIYCQTTVLHGIYHHKYRLYEIQTFLLVTVLFTSCWKKCIF